MPFVVFVAGFVLILLGVILAWYLLIKTEGVYLGWRVVVWLYDLYAARYDHIKDYDDVYETYFLGRPVVQRLHDKGVAQALVLDVATGTGRLPLTLLEQWDFHGHVIGLDLSRQMLFQAAVKLAHYAGTYDLVWDTAMDLPFVDASFDLVTCLEAWEFLPHLVNALHEIVRVLKPGGWLLLTNRRGRDARLMPSRTFSSAQVFALLEEEMGLVDVEKSLWQVDYELFWAHKPGTLPVGALNQKRRTAADVLRCPNCREAGLVPLETGEWVCTGCETRIAMGADGVIELFRLRQRRSSHRR